MMLPPSDTIQTHGALILSEPAEFDVLCGKDKTYKRHRGNQVFRSMIESWLDIYAGATSKKKKMSITREIVTCMKNKYTSRFIKPAVANYGAGNHDEKGHAWEEISDKLARDKVSHALRFAVSQYRHDANKATTEAATRMRETKLVFLSSLGKKSSMGESIRSSSSSSSDENTCDDGNNGSADDRHIITLYERQQTILDDMKYSSSSSTKRRPSSSSSSSSSRSSSDVMKSSSVEAIENNKSRQDNNSNVIGRNCYSGNEQAAFLDEDPLWNLSSEDLKFLQVQDDTNEDINPTPLPLLSTCSVVSLEDWKEFASII